jgi:inner membrane protein
MNEPVLPASPHKPSLARPGTTLKMGMVALLVLILLIPLAMIKSVLGERLERRNEAVADITSTWGGEQTLVGPVLVLPYRYPVKAIRQQVVRGKKESVEVMETAVAQAFFLPTELGVVGTVAPKKLYRGIYEAVVYNGTLTVSGRFAPPALDELKIADVLWDEAKIALSVTDLRGAREALKITIGGQAFDLVPGTPLAGFPDGVHARLVKGQELLSQGFAFSIPLTLNGSSGIDFAPVGMQNRVELSSTWPDPRFRGAFLPTERRVGTDGFEAEWQMSYYGRSYPQQWTDQGEAGPFNRDGVVGSLFGVDFLASVDSYRLVERSIKYGVLFVALVFAAFFLFEVLSAVRVHPLQYLLVGAALCLFYLALLSLAEFARFSIAYLAGAGAAILLIGLYCAKILGGGRRALVITAELVATYGFLYVTLQLQDYSLLLGTAGLFLVLAIIMYATRNINWYEQGNAKGG